MSGRWNPMSKKPKNLDNIYFIFSQNYSLPDHSLFFTFNTPEYVTRQELDKLETLDEEVDKMNSYPLAESMLATILGKSDD